MEKSRKKGLLLVSSLPAELLVQNGFWSKYTKADLIFLSMKLNIVQLSDIPELVKTLGIFVSLTV